MILCNVTIITQPILVTVSLNAVIDAYVDTEETYTISGMTQTLTHNPVFIYGVYLEGQRLTAGQRYSQVGTTITFDQDYSGMSVTISYKY